MKVIKSQIGFCVGIEAAYEKMNETAEKTGSFIATHSNATGPWDTLGRIERKDPELLQLYPNLDKVSVVHDVKELKEGDRVVVGFHGLPQESQVELKDRGVNLVRNFHCPFIATMDRTADKLASEGYDLFLVGKKSGHHTEDIVRFAEKHGRTCTILEKVEDVDQEIPAHAGDRKFALLGVVTGNTETWKQVVDRIQERNLPVKIAKTVCSDSFLRQDEARDIATDADIVILIPGAAATSVLEIASRVNGRIHAIGSKDEIRSEWFKDAKTVGVLGGITVPRWVIDDVASHIKALSPSLATA